MLTVLIFGNISSQIARENTVRLMFYNVENLFDIYDDSLTDDNDFLPDGLMRWNFTRYNKKINSLYKTIVAAGEWEPPAVVAFCEVENKKVLEDLVYNTYLSKYHYGIIHEDSPDRRGIDVCLIYRKDFVSVVDYEYWKPPEEINNTFFSRTILYSRLIISCDTIHLIMNHWPSRRGGILAGEPLRMKIASMIKAKIDSLYVSSKIIIAGDFNCAPGDTEISILERNKAGSLNFLSNLSEKYKSGGGGTYRYRGTWEIIDQVLVSEEILKCKSGLFTSSEMMSIFKPDFLLRQDSKYPGSTPYSTFRGYRYQGGYSDHLPVLLDLGFKQNHLPE